jgi:protein SCO1/2
MRLAIPIVLWLVVLIAFGTLGYIRYNQLYPQVLTSGGNDSDPPGRFLTDTPWRHFQDVPPFQMKNQLGEALDSQSLLGKPYLISFFFAGCPVICREMNKGVAAINDQLRDQDIVFLSITVDPTNDTPEVLNRYAQDFGAKPGRWWFLTEQMYKIKQLGEQVFEVPIGNNPSDHTHTQDLLLVDKWGRFRDRFRWSDPYDVRRLLKVVREVAGESEPPLEKSFRTRNIVAGQPPISINTRPWIREFHLIDADGQPFYSRDLTGQVWIANFFFTRCKKTCPAQTAFLNRLRVRLKAEMPVIVSITSDPGFDTPSVIKEYARSLEADERWKFCTGDSLLIRRIGSEFFEAFADQSNHSAKLFVIDRWHQVRGSFEVEKTGQEEAMIELIRKLEQEDRPVQTVSSSRRPRWEEDLQEVADE